MTDDEIRQDERNRIARWLLAKSAETEDLMKLAAERGSTEFRARGLLHAKQVGILISVLSEMVERNVLPLQADVEELRRLQQTRGGNDAR